MLKLTNIESKIAKKDLADRVRDAIMCKYKDAQIKKSLTWATITIDNFESEDFNYLKYLEKEYVNVQITVVSKRVHFEVIDPFNRNFVSSAIILRGLKEQE